MLSGEGISLLSSDRNGPAFRFSATGVGRGPVFVGRCRVGMWTVHAHWSTMGAHAG